MMSRRSTISYLLPELCIVIWAYVGAELSELFRFYAEYVKRPTKFCPQRIGSRRRWQEIANTCAAFYPQGCEWLFRLNRLPHIQWLLVTYHAIRHGNFDFATDNRIRDELMANRRLSFDTIFDPKEYAGYSHFFLAGEVLAIAAIDSNQWHIFQHIREFVSLSPTINVHLFGRDFMGKPPLEIYEDATTLTLNVRELLSDACCRENVKALENALPLARFTAEETAGWCYGMFFVYDNLGTPTAEILFAALKRSGHDLVNIKNTFSIQEMRERFERPSGKQLAIFIVKKEGIRAIQSFKHLFLPEHFEELIEWTESVIGNDDIFWRELGLI